MKIRPDEAARAAATAVAVVVALLAAASAPADQGRAEGSPEPTAPLAVAPPGACPEPVLRSVSPSPDDFAISGRPARRFVAAQVAASVRVPQVSPRPVAPVLPRRDPCDAPDPGCGGRLMVTSAPPPPPQFEEPPVVPGAPPGTGSR